MKVSWSYFCSVFYSLYHERVSLIAERKSRKAKAKEEAAKEDVSTNVEALEQAASEDMQANNDSVLMML